MATQLPRFKKWWLAGDLRREFSVRILGFLKGETEASRRLFGRSMYFHLDKPRFGFVVVAEDPLDVSAWIVNLDDHLSVDIRVVVDGIPHESHRRPRVDVQRAFGPERELSVDTGFAAFLALPRGLHRMRIS